MVKMLMIRMMHMTGIIILRTCFGDEAEDANACHTLMHLKKFFSKQFNIFIKHYLRVVNLYGSL